MNRSVKSILVCFFWCVIIGRIYGQQIPFDSLVLGVDKLNPRLAPQLAEVYRNQSKLYFSDSNLELDGGLLATTWAETYLDHFLYDSAIHYFLKALEIKKEGTDSLGMARIHYQLGIAYEGREEYVLSTETLHKSLELYKALDLTQEIGRLFLAVGNNYYYSGDANIAFGYYDEAERIFSKLGNVESWSEVLSNRASLYNIMGDNDSALHYYRKALELLTETDYDLQKIDIAIGLGIVYEETGELNSAYREYQKVKSLAAQNNYIKELAQAIQNFGYYFLARGELDSAEWYANKTLEYASELNSFQLRSNAYEILHQVYYRQGRSKKAYDHLNIVRNELDSVFNENSSKQLNSLYARYQIEKNQNDLAQMELELQRQRLETRRVQNFRNLLIVGLIAALFIVFLVIRGQKLKERTYRILEKKNEEIRRIETAKNKWFLNIAHDLRTPITLIKGPLEQLSRLDYFQKEDKTLMEIASRSIMQLEGLTDEILDLSKLEDSKVKLDTSACDLKELLTEVVVSFQSYADRKHINLSLSDGEPPQLVHVDKEKIRKVLNNLLSNAVRFTPKKGSIKVSLGRKDKGSTIMVEDTGVGIPKEEHQKIFERFYQASNQDHASTGGSGIGLAFSKEVMDLHGGDIWVESDPDHGSCFTLFLPEVRLIESDVPIKPPEISKPVDPTPVNGEINTRFMGKLVYIADDNGDMRDYIVGILSDKFLVKQFRDGREVLDEMNRKKPDLVISDIMMPRMDGVSLAEKIKAKKQWRSIPFIALTAVIDEQVKMDTLRIGVDDFILKPFNPEELLIRIDNLMINSENRLATDSGEEVQMESFQEKLLAKLEEKVQKHIDDPDFNVLRLADALSISERQLYRYLKQSTGFTPANFVKEIRLQKAFELARRNVFTTTAELAYAVGFQHPNYFSVVFKKRFGRKPSDFLKAS